MESRAHIIQVYCTVIIKSDCSSVWLSSLRDLDLRLRRHEEQNQRASTLPLRYTKWLRNNVSETQVLGLFATVASSSQS